MLNKKLFSIATSLLLFSSFGMAEEEEKGFRSGLARASCSTVDGVYTCSGQLERQATSYSKNKALTINDATIVRATPPNQTPAEVNAAKAFTGINLDSAPNNSFQDITVNLNNTLSGLAPGGSANNNVELKLIESYKAANTEVKNANININGSNIYGRTLGMHLQLAPSDVNNKETTFSLDGLNMNIKNSNFTYISDNMGESAIVGIRMDEGKNNAGKSHFSASNVHLSLENSSVYGESENYSPLTGKLGVPRSVTGVLVGKKDENNKANTTKGDVNTENVLVEIKNSTVSGSVKGVEANSEGGSVNANGNVILSNNSKVDNGVIGSFVGNLNIPQYSGTPSPEVIENAYNLRTHYAKINSKMANAQASGSVALDDSTVLSFLYGSAALNQNKAYSESSVSLKNGSIIAKDAYGAYAVSKEDNATSLGALSLASNSIIQGDAYGAYLSSAKDAKAEANINIADSEVVGNLYGTYIDNPDNKEIANTEASSIFLLDNANINGKIAGNTMGNVAGDVNATGQFTLKNSSNLKGDIYANQIGNVGGEVKNASALLSLENSKANANLYGNSIGNIGENANLSSSIFLTSSEVAGDIYGNIIGDIAGNLKAENQLIIDSSEVGGNIYVNKIQSANDVDIKTLLQISNENAKEIKGDIYANYFEKISGNIDNAELNIILDNAKVTSNIYGNYIKEFGNEDEEAKVVSNITLKNNAHLEKDLTANYFGKVNGHINSEANIILDNANINGHIYGNFLDNFDENDQKGGNAVLKSELTLTNNVNIVGDIYGNYVKDAKGDVKAESIITLNEANGKDEGTIYGNYIENAKNVDVSSSIIVKEGKDKV